MEFSKRDIAELYELREALEVYAIAKAAEHTPQPADLDTIHRLISDTLVLRDELVQSGEVRLNAQQMQRFVQIDLNFHATLVRWAANRRIWKAFADTRVLLNIFGLRRKGHDAAQLAEIHRYHSEILAAVARKDSKSAAHWLGEHIRISKQERLTEYDQWEHEIAMGEAIIGFAEVDTS
jgi:DNA-binding GntR family transcriptional regulator